MHVCYSFSRDQFEAGSILSVFLKISQAKSNWIIYGQSVGYVQIDKRWLKHKNCFENVEEYVPTKTCPIPFNTRQNSFVNYITFASTREVISASQIRDHGVSLHVDLPFDILPSFVGLSGLISYVIILTIHIDDKIMSAFIPFKVTGHGTSMVKRLAPFPLSIFDLSSLSYDSYVSGTVPNNIQNNANYNDSTIYPNNSHLYDKIYGIRDDDGLICNIQMSSEVIYASNSIFINFNFAPNYSGSEMLESKIMTNHTSDNCLCYAIRVKLIQRECSLEVMSDNDGHSVDNHSNNFHHLDAFNNSSGSSNLHTSQTSYALPTSLSLDYYGKDLSSIMTDGSARIEDSKLYLRCHSKHILQERVLDECFKYTECMQHMVLELSTSASVCSTCCTPAFTVTYCIEIEFFLKPKTYIFDEDFHSSAELCNDEDDITPLTWSKDIIIIPNKTSSRQTREVMCAMFETASL